MKIRFGAVASTLLMAGFGLLTAPTAFPAPHLCTQCMVVYQNCVLNGGAMDECEYVLDECRAAQCPSSAKVRRNDSLLGHKQPLKMSPAIIRPDSALLAQAK